MAKIIQIDGLSDDVIQVLNHEANKNSLSRNALLVVIIETFAKNVQALDATEILATPLQDVTQQLNELTHVITKSNYNISQDFQALQAAVQNNTFAVAELLQKVDKLVNKVVR